MKNYENNQLVRFEGSRAGSNQWVSEMGWDMGWDVRMGGFNGMAYFSEGLSSG